MWALGCCRLVFCWAFVWGRGGGGAFLTYTPDSRKIFDFRVPAPCDLGFRVLQGTASHFKSRLG